jgi:hypothetical protein
MRNQGEEYTGSIKTKRVKDRGKGVPIPVKEPPKKSREIGGYPGNYKMFDLNPSMRNQGEEFTGYIKKPKFKRSYIQNPNTTDEALKKKRPGSSTYLVDGLQVKVKEKKYSKKVNAAEGALPGIKPTKSSIKAAEYARGVKMNWKYVRNPSSSKDALLTKEPGKAFGKSTDYQGNSKMRKFALFGKKELHPDAQFVKTNKNNVKEERGVVTNFKLWWARLFKKNDTQPDHLKEKHGKPRYDKGEQGMWYE